MSEPRTPRVWSVLTVALTLALVGVLALGAWARWRPISEHDAARLTARAAVAHLLESRVAEGEIPRTTLQRQLAALGPDATPSQRARLTEPFPTAASGPRDLPAAAADLRERSLRAPNPHLAAVLAGIATSWSAAHHQKHPNDAPLSRSEAEGTTAAAEDATAPGNATAAPEPSNASRCEPELTAVITQLDRAQYVADAAAARLSDDQPAREALDELRQNAQRIEQLPSVTSLLTCEPPPERGAYALPRDLATEPAAATNTATKDLARASLTAVATADASERKWLLDVLDTAARASARLSPEDPVPALVGQP